jgi:hypothetical protein
MGYFEKLEFETHPSGLGGTQATIFFDNGYGASVITGAMFYTSRGAPYELAVLKGDSIHSTLCYETEITSDVIGHQTREEVDALLERIAALPKEVAA